MSEQDELQDVHGIGPAVEARLREAGVTSLADLAGADPATISTALADLRGMTAERVADWIAEAGRRTRATPAESTGGERRETFVLTLAIGPDGEVVRSGVRHVRTDHERGWVGWRRDELDRFVADQAGLAPAAERRDPSPLPAFTLHDDLGLVVGGRRAAVQASIDAAPLRERDVVDFAYRAVLTARGIGDEQARPVTWLAGTADASGPLDLTFPEVELGAGVHRAEVTVEVTPLVRIGSDA